MFGAAVRPDGAPTPTLERRVAAAHRFGERLDPPPLFLLSGAVGRHPPSEAAVMARLLRAAGVPPDRMLLDERSRDTLDTVLAARILLRRAHHRGPVRAASSAYHLPRCLLLLRLVGLPARPVPPPRISASRSFARRWRWRLRELPALPWDVLLLALHAAGWRRITASEPSAPTPSTPP